MDFQSSESVVYSNNSALQTKALDLILEAKRKHPFASVTLLVDNPLQGTLARRQIIELAADRGVSAWANLKVMTPSELVTTLSSITGSTDFNEPKLEYLEAVIFSLMNQEQVGDDSEQSMATASAMAKVFRKMQFISDKNLDELINSSFTTSTQKYVFGIIKNARKKIDLRNAADACAEIIDVASQVHEESIKNYVGTILNLLTATPNTLSDLLSKLSQFCRIANFSQASVNREVFSDTAKTVLVSTPDPSSEVSILTRDLMQSLKNVRADRIAILYPEESEYGNQLRDCLTEAGIQWHGRGRTFIQNSTICRSLDLILEILTYRSSTFSGLDRPRLMRLIENGHITIQSLPLDFSKVRRWIRRQEIYADCIAWISVLDDIAESDYDPENSVAIELKQFLTSFEEHLTLISKSTSWSELGRTILKLLEYLYGHSGLNVQGTLEEDVWRRLKALLLGELSQLQPLLAGVGSFNFVNEVTNLRNMVKSKVGDRAISHGNLSTGVLIGDVGSARFLTFDKVYVLGATEGLLPAVAKEDPYLPVSVLNLIGEQNMALFSRENAVDRLADDLSCLVGGVPNVVVLRPRGGTKTKLENEPSRFLALELNEKKNPSFPSVFQVENRLHSFTLDLGSGRLEPVNLNDFMQLKQKLKPTPDTAFMKSLSNWRKPSSNEYFGNLSERSSIAPIWSPENSKPLSSSAIDTFITCKYQFLMTRVLRFNSSKRNDTLEEFNASKFGIYFHKQMENFVNDALAKGVAPDFGGGWPQGSAGVFIEEYFLKNLPLFVNRGQAGWNRSFKYHLEQVLNAIPQFFDLEPEEIRASSKLAIYKPEFSFGEEGDESELTVKDEENSTEYHIRGQIDRLDASADRAYAAVMDFKTGSLKAFRPKLQIKPGMEFGNTRKTVQDIIYRLAALAKFQNVEDVKVVFVFIPDEGIPGFLHAKFANDPKNFLLSTLRELRRSGETGDFVPTGKMADDHQAMPYKFCSVCRALGDVAQLAGATPSAKPKEEDEIQND